MASVGATVASTEAGELDGIDEFDETEDEDEDDDEDGTGTSDGTSIDGDPLVIDMGTSAFMGTDVQFRARIGAPIPAGVALGPDGRPTTDASEARKGVLLPFGGPEGGYKGFGLASMVEILSCVMTGMKWGVIRTNVPRLWAAYE